MFRITRGITIQPAPAFSPSLHFPDGTPLSVYRHDESDDAPAMREQPADAPDPAAATDESADPLSA